MRRFLLFFKMSLPLAYFKLSQKGKLEEKKRRMAESEESLKKREIELRKRLSDLEIQLVKANPAKSRVSQSST